MTLWFVLALMTAAAIFAVLWPLGRHAAARRDDPDVLIYRDQLDEIERDRASGLIGSGEAEAARVEVARRLIARADATPGQEVAVPASAWRRRIVAVIAFVGLPLVAGTAYLAWGSPGLPGQPLAGRIGAPGQDASIDVLIAQVEARLAQNPKDGRGWAVLAPVYLRVGRIDDAVTAYRNAVAFNGETAPMLSGLGEAEVMVANGVVTQAAKEAFDRALALDPQDVKSRYFVGLAAEQDGRPGEAADLWRAMLASAPADAPWAGFVRNALARVEASSVGGPNAADVAAASKLDDAQRGDMIQGMVASLAERLKSDPANAEGWLRLLRSYIVLGERDKALAAVADARRALQSEPDKLQRVEQLVKELGLDG